jgi:hypothetical protein
VKEDQMPGPAKRQLVASLMASIVCILCFLPALSFIQLIPVQKSVSRMYIRHLQSEMKTMSKSMHRETEVRQRVETKPIPKLESDEFKSSDPT